MIYEVFCNHSSEVARIIRDDTLRILLVSIPLLVKYLRQALVLEISLVRLLERIDTITFTHSLTPNPFRGGFVRGKRRRERPCTSVCTVVCSSVKYLIPG